MTLALLLTAVTGAWADKETIATNQSQSSYTGTNITISVTNAGDEDGCKLNGPDGMTISTGNGDVITQVVLTIGWYSDYAGSVTASPGTCSVSGSGNGSTYVTITDINASSVTIGCAVELFVQISQVQVTYESAPAAPAEAPVTVAWNASTKTGTFTMPGSDVVLTPIYAKAATFATTGTEPEVKTLLPEAAEGVIAGTDASLIAEGTGIVAFAGTSTEVTQGTLMYAVGTSATEAPALTAFSATVPTAENVADDGADVYVWYYIKGADAPEGDAATLDNTFDDTEPACLTVTVLTNKFDITLKAANANTIEAGKATVTVGGTAATVTDGKLQGVKMGSEVKLEANPGYKFRKVEVKKQEAGKPLANATTEDLGKVIGADGNIYDSKDAAEAANTTAVAMIAYVGSETADDTYTNGLAIALADEAEKQNQATAISTCANKTAVTGAKWMLPKLQQVHKMCAANGGDAMGHFGLDNALATAGGNKMSGTYWTSSQKEGRTDRYYDLAINEKYDNYSESDSNYATANLVRACLAF